MHAPTPGSCSAACAVLALLVFAMKIGLAAACATRFNPQFDENLAAELDEREADVVYITKQSLWPEVAQRIKAQGYAVTPQGAPYRDRIIFTVAPME